MHVLPRRTHRALGAIAALVVVVGVAGCGPDSHLQHQESVVRVRTCQSRLERRFGRPPPSIGADHWLRDTARTPSLHGPANQSEAVRECNRIGDELAKARELRRVASSMGRMASSIGAERERPSRSPLPTTSPSPPSTPPASSTGSASTP